MLETYTENLKNNNQIQMNKYLLKNAPCILIIITLTILSIINIANLKYGFFTAYDHAYFLLKLKEGYTLSSITGKSQWNLIAVHWFPFLDLTSKVNSFLASSILMWFSILIMTLTCCVIYDKKKNYEISICWSLWPPSRPWLLYIYTRGAFPPCVHISCHTSHLLEGQKNHVYQFPLRDFRRHVISSLHTFLYLQSQRHFRRNAFYSKLHWKKWI